MIHRLLADADLNHAIISGVVRRNPGIDFKRAEDVPLVGLADEAVLRAATQENRVLVTHDVSTMPAHLGDFVSTAASPGVIVIPQDLRVGRAIEYLLLICEACEATDLTNRVCLVPSLVIFGF
jgi:hypothetical protein